MPEEPADRSSSRPWARVATRIVLALAASVLIAAAAGGAAAAAGARPTLVAAAALTAGFGIGVWLTRRLLGGAARALSAGGCGLTLRDGHDEGI